MIRFGVCALLVALAFGRARAAGPLHAKLEPDAQRRILPAFQLTDASGKPVALGAMRGKVVLLNFWATECGGCRQEIPSFVDIYKRYRAEGLDVVGVAEDMLYEDLKTPREAWAKIQPFVAAESVPYTIAIRRPASLASFDIQALPLTFLVDKRGRIAATYAGVAHADNVAENIGKLLREK